MRHSFLPFLIAVSLAFTFTAGPADAGGVECARWEHQREQLREQLRRPHTSAQANRLHTRLRELRSRIAHGCR